MPRACLLSILTCLCAGLAVRPTFGEEGDAILRRPGPRIDDPNRDLEPRRIATPGLAGIL